MEEQAFRKGLHKQPSMLDYKSLTALDMPETWVVPAPVIVPPSAAAPVAPPSAPVTSAITAIPIAAIRLVLTPDKAGTCHPS